jgi:hypothetical protein
LAANLALAAWTGSSPAFICHTDVGGDVVGVVVGAVVGGGGVSISTETLSFCNVGSCVNTAGVGAATSTDGASVGVAEKVGKLLA